ncbi:hypothetical protein K435DRAFT_587790, partial [Dendrothele bispora CBS 962.96]
VFSSSKETDAARRSRLSPEMMEMLQILKYLYRSERLNFTDHWIVKNFKGQLTGTQLDVDPAVIQELVSSGRIDELTKVIEES